ncbi:MAG: NAD(P)H-dependent oxidoreductase [Lachnospiraceae bacterium]|nr:NAD(P)H-dependent oxidoreductase [Lachnospiraceae bacterium]MDE7272330.1 NAD(P)H-dependent oxidoreductase [Lachnospiraceae bacterium]
MKIVLINGSPKVNNTASGVLLADLKRNLSNNNSNHHSGKTEIKEISLRNPVVSQETLKALKNTDAWVFACPLYVDGLPAHLLSCLIQLAKTDWQNDQIQIYGIVNCGFYEGIQAEFALDILQNWCAKTGLHWSGGIGVGGGGALGQLPTLENGHGPKAPVEKALRAMAGKIVQRETQDNQYVSIAFPRFLYQMAAQIGWRQRIRANGGKIRDLGNCPALSEKYIK